MASLHDPARVDNARNVKALLIDQDDLGELLAARRSIEHANQDDGVKRIMGALIEGIVALGLRASEQAFG